MIRGFIIVISEKELFNYANIYSLNKYSGSDPLYHKICTYIAFEHKVLEGKKFELKEKQGQGSA